MRLLVALLLVCSVILPAHAYEVEVTKGKDFPANAGTIAVLPANCPPDLDCVGLNRVIATRLAERPHIPDVALLVVRQIMFDEGVERVTDDNRAALAEKLKADSFFVITVGSATSENEGSVGVPVASTLFLFPMNVRRGQLEVRIVSAKDGKVLMKANGSGTSELRSALGVLGQTFAAILDEAFRVKR